MISESVIWWSLSAVLLFWSVGAYSRLGRLRSLVLRSFAALVVPMQRWAETVPSCPVKHADPIQEKPSQAWVALLEAQVQYSTVLTAARTCSVDGAAINALTVADMTLQMAWRRASSDAIDVFGATFTETLCAEWRDTRQQIRPAAHSFAQAVNSYNAAITQFPALLLAKLFGFRAATLLPIEP